MADDTLLLMASSASDSSGRPNVKMPMKISYKFDVLFLKHFLQVCRPLTKHTNIPSVLCFLFLIKLLEEYCVYQVGMITSLYYKILAEKDLSYFFSHSLVSVGLILLVSFVNSTDQFISSTMQLCCRKQLTDYLHQLYFSKNNFYKLNVLKRDAIDNPDQRITQDVDKLSNVLSTVVPALVISPVTIGYYTYIAYTTTDWVGPVGIFAYFVVGTIINKYLMSPIVNRVYQQEQREGYFRFKHMQVRTDAESIAFQDGTSVELEYTSGKLNNLIWVQKQLFLTQYPLNTSVNCFNYLGSIVSFFILATPIFSGRYDTLPTADLSALISKNAFVSIYLVSCFSKLVSLSENFATLAGTTHRIAQLENALLHLSSDERCQSEIGEQPQCSSAGSAVIEGPLINIDKLSYQTLDGSRQLLNDLSLEICSGDNVLVVGSSGCGKTSLFRVLKGLWKASTGSVFFHFWQDVFFVPQKSLLTDGTLRQQIIYPHYTGTHHMTEDDNATLLRYLELADLMHVHHRSGGLDNIVDWNWYDVLSPGEIQRLCFVRMLYHKPLIALLDEALSAVNTDMEEKLYKKCKDLKITVVSIGHRNTLLPYHDLLLTFRQDGSWNYERLR